MKRPDFADVYACLPALAAHADEQRSICLADGIGSRQLAEAWKSIADAARELNPQTLGAQR